jgi:hypothetical protein
MPHNGKLLTPSSLNKKKSISAVRVPEKTYRLPFQHEAAGE